MKTKKLITTAIFIFVVGLVLVTPQAYAQEQNSKNTNFFEGLIQMIVQKFGLNKTEVQSAVKDYQSQQKQVRQQKTQQNQEDRLNQLVQQKKITEAQKQLIIDKLKELQANRKANNEDTKNKTPEERKTEMEAQKKALDDWAKQNGIDPQYLMGGFGQGGIGRRGFRGITPTAVPSQ
jgi:membrane protein involved in colicin uptake